MTAAPSTAFATRARTPASELASARSASPDLLDIALRIARVAREETLPRFGTSIPVSDKGAEVFDPVTEADRQAEAAMRRVLAERTPGFGVHGEEHGLVRERAPWRWVLDPIDGTRAYICGFPTWTTLIALLFEGSPVLGLIDAPAADITVVGLVRDLSGRAAGAYRVREGELDPVRVRSCPDLSHATLSTTGPELLPSPPVREAWWQACARSKLQRYGGDGLAYGLLARGLIDGVVEAGLKPYDLAAPLAVVRAAGGVATGFDGGDPLVSGSIIAAGDPRIHAELRRLFAPTL